MASHWHVKGVEITEKPFRKADGFAVKMRAGEGSVIRGAFFHNNIDDGFDLFNKIEDGANGVEQHQQRFQNVRRRLASCAQSEKQHRCWQPRRADGRKQHGSG
ncbi:MAG: hypothetical protein ACR5LD_03755 [Symbiopectobacterium sp.]